MSHDFPSSERTGPERSGPEQSSLERSSPERSSPERSSPERSNPARASLGRATVAAMVGGLLLVVTLVLVSYLVEGLQLATRSATDLVMPVGLVWIGMFTAMVWFALRRIWSGALLGAAGFLFVGLTANPYLASTFMQSIEMSEREPQATQDNPYRTVVVLGGGSTMTPQQTPELFREGERLFSAAQLWHAGLVSSVICTGSSSDSDAHPRDIGEELLVSVGIPPEAIFKIPGENTSQEMASLKAFLADPPAEFPASGEVALITSAFHMERAMRLADTQNLDLDPLPCGYRSGFYQRFSPRAMIPKAEAAGAFGAAMKETLAELVGR